MHKANFLDHFLLSSMEMSLFFTRGRSRKCRFNRNFNVHILLQVPVRFPRVFRCEGRGQPPTFATRNFDKEGKVSITEFSAARRLAISRHTPNFPFHNTYLHAPLFKFENIFTLKTMLNSF